MYYQVVTKKNKGTGGQKRAKQPCPINHAGKREWRNAKEASAKRPEGIIRHLGGSTSQKLKNVRKTESHLLEKKDTYGGKIQWGGGHARPGGQIPHKRKKKTNKDRWVAANTPGGGGDQLCENWATRGEEGKKKKIKTRCKRNAWEEHGSETHEIVK